METPAYEQVGDQGCGLGIRANGESGGVAQAAARGIGIWCTGISRILLWVANESTKCAGWRGHCFTSLEQRLCQPRKNDPDNLQKYLFSVAYRPKTALPDEQQTARQRLWFKNFAKAAENSV